MLDMIDRIKEVFFEAMHGPGSYVSTRVMAECAAADREMAARQAEEERECAVARFELEREKEEARRQHWRDYQREPFSAEQRQAEELDNGDLGGIYQRDEREQAHFVGLVFDQKSQNWKAQFQAAHLEPQQRRGLPSTIDLFYAEVMNAGQLMDSVGTKPSQCLKAMAAFHAKFDYEANKIHFDF